MRKATAKQKLARRMMSPKDIRMGTSKFLTKNWSDRKWAIECKVENSINRSRGMPVMESIS